MAFVVYIQFNVGAPDIIIFISLSLSFSMVAVNPSGKLVKLTRVNLPLSFAKKLIDGVIDLLLFSEINSVGLLLGRKNDAWFCR